MTQAHAASIRNPLLTHLPLPSRTALRNSARATLLFCLAVPLAFQLHAQATVHGQATVQGQATTSAPAVAPEPVQVASAVEPAASVKTSAPLPALTPSLTDAAQQEGDRALSENRYVAALTAYKRASSDSAVVANRMGIAYHHLFALGEARKQYERAIRLDPHYAEAFNNLGAVLYGQNQFKQAEKAYGQAILYQPRFAMAYKNLGITYFADHDADHGTAAFHQAMTIDPKIFSDQSGVVAEAATHAQLGSMNYALAKIYAQAGQDDQAVKALRNATRDGFNDNKQLKRDLKNDQDLARLSQTPGYKAALDKN